MTFEFLPDKEDYVIYYLYSSSQNARTRKNRKRRRILLPALFLILAVSLLYQGGYFLGSCYLIFSFGWYLFFPYLNKRYYIRHYRQITEDLFNNNDLKRGTVIFNGDHIIIKDDGNESKILNTEIKEINEILSHIFVKFNGGTSLILPKDKIPGYDVLIIYLKDIAGQLHISYNSDFSWKWE